MKKTGLASFVLIGLMLASILVGAMSGAGIGGAEEETEYINIIDTGLPTTSLLNTQTSLPFMPNNNSLSSEIDDILNDNPVFVLFYADWCHSCHQQMPIIDELEKEYAEKLAFIRINVNEEPDYAEEFGAVALPTMFVISGKNEGGYVKQEISGFTEKTRLREIIALGVGLELDDVNNTDENSLQAEKDNDEVNDVRDAIFTAASTITCNSCEDCTNKLKSGLYDTVILTTDITDHVGSCISLLLGESNVVFDCNGHSIDGDDTAIDPDHGVAMMHGTGNTIKNCVISDFSDGIYLWNATNHVITNNTVTSNDAGIELGFSDSNNINNNNVIENNGNGVWFASDSNENNLNSNIICSNSIDIKDDDENFGDENTCNTTYNWDDAGTTGCTHACMKCVIPTDDLYINKDTTLCPGFYNIQDAGATGVIIINASNIVLDCNGATINGTMTGSDYGIYSRDYDNVTIKNCNVMNYLTGIEFEMSSDSTITHNNLSFNRYGIYLFYSDDSMVTNNNANSNKYKGIGLASSSNNRVTNNNANKNEDGIFLGSFSPNNKIAGNNASSNKQAGIYIYGDSSSNNFSNNKIDNNLYGIYLGSCICPTCSHYCPGGNFNNIIKVNEILNNEIGIFSNQSNSMIDLNIVCDNIKSDFNSSNWLSSSGGNNTCDKSDGWNDAGTTGCTYPCPVGKPDLVITDVWNEDSLICYQIRNIGDAVAPECHYTYLFIDGENRVSDDRVDADLEPGERWRGCFDFDWVCTPPEDIIVICADYGGDVAESEETNNCRNESWKCDSTPPKIISGPTLQEVTRNSAVIFWETNEDSDSVVKYGRTARIVGGDYGYLEETDSTLVRIHSITLVELDPSTTYYFVAQSTDASGNTVASNDITFETLPLLDNINPSVSIIDPGVCRETVIISAEASDNIGVEKVEFFLADELVFTDYSPPYELPLNTYSYVNGKHVLKAIVEDHSGMVSIRIIDIDIANIIDVNAPEVEIYYPSNGATVLGQVHVHVCVKDDSGWSEVEWFVDGKKIGGGKFPTSPSLDLKFWWDTRFWENDGYTLAVRATDESGKTGVDTVYVHVNNEAPPLRPKLAITKHNVTRHKNFFGIDLTVENQGTAWARNIEIQDSLKAFQPVSNHVGSVDYKAEFDPSTWEGNCIITDTLDLNPGQSRYYTFKAVPVLSNPVSPPKPSIGDSIKLSYEGPYGAKYSETVSFRIKETTLNYPNVPIATAYNDALKEADYLIVTNPNRLFTHNQGNEDKFNELLSYMAELASLKNGSLGYLIGPEEIYIAGIGIIPYPYSIILKSSIAPNGDWAKKLHPKFSKPLKGYLLIVGETEIVPAWNDIPSGTSWPWILTDNLYADIIGNDNKPDISVGRIIGNSASDLIIPLNTSINLHKGTPGYDFDRSDALSVSGGDGNVIIFEKNANDVANLLDDEFKTDKIHCANYFKKASHTSIFHKNDGFLTGDVLGDGKSEIIIADDSANKVYVYDGNMNKQSEFPVPSWSGTEHDAIATGDLLGDDKEEIIIADSFTGEIYVFDATGSKKGPGTVLVNFESGDRLAIGDVVGDTKNEIIIVNFFLFKFFSTIKFYDLSGIKVGEISKSIDKYDGFGVGNLLPGGKDEIVITDRTNNKIVVYNPTGDKLKEINHAYKKSDAFMVRDFYGDSKKEIIVAEHDTGIVIFFYIAAKGEPYRRWFDFKAGFGKNDGLAGGDVVGNSVKEVLVADHSSGLIEISDERCAGRMKPFFMNKIKSKDVIFFNDHGNEDTLGGILSTWDCPSLDFGKTNPFLFASACFTGNYEWGDGNNLAEALLKSGASLYLGASQTANAVDNIAFSKFFEIWVNSPKSVGRALVETERQLVDANLVSWVMKYNLYGDPKLGVSSKKAASFKAGNPPKASALVEVVVPDFEVTTIDGVDYVEMPGGTLIYDVGKPMVPLYSVQFDYPRGTEIQEVTLTERTNLVTTTGLNIANTVFIENGKSLAPEAMASEWYPEEVYRWDTIQNPDGSITLIIVIYPFYYNPLTTDVRFYKNYSFDINYTISNVTITSLSTDKYAYQQDELVMVDIGLNNSGEAQDVIVSALIKQYGSGEVVGGLLLSTLTNFTGPASFSPQWDSSDVEPGYYSVEVTLKDTGGNVLDRKTEMFRLGISSGEITNFTATPEYFDIGDDIDINIKFNNNGTVNITGTAIIKIINTTGDVVEEFRHNVTDLIPSESISFSNTWNTSGAKEGSYNIIGYVLYDSKATDPVTVTISSRVIPTNRVYPDPQHSCESFCSTADVEIWVNATDTFQSGQIKLVYDPDCANVTNWARNTATFPMGFWTHTDGQEWIGFTATTALTGEYLIGTLTIHCVSEEECNATLDFVDPSALFDQSGNEITANWVDGTFECGGRGCSTIS